MSISVVSGYAMETLSTTRVSWWYSYDLGTDRNLATTLTQLSCRVSLVYKRPVPRDAGRTPDGRPRPSALVQHTPCAAMGILRAPRIVRAECLCCCREMPPWRVRTCARGHTTCNDCRGALGRPLSTAAPRRPARGGGGGGGPGGGRAAGWPIPRRAVGTVVAVVLCGCSVVAAGYASAASGPCGFAASTTPAGSTGGSRRTSCPRAWSSGVSPWGGCAATGPRERGHKIWRVGETPCPAPALPDPPRRPRRSRGGSNAALPLPGHPVARDRLRNIRLCLS